MTGAGSGAARQPKPVGVAVLGRGLLARRARAAIRRLSATRNVFVSPDPDGARVVLLALTEPAAADFLAANQELAGDRLVYDFSGYTKTPPQRAASGLASYALGQALFGAEPCRTAGVIPVPACYASAVLVPLWYLHRYHAQAVTGLHVSAIGGRSTLGASGVLAPRSFRTASAASEELHRTEVLTYLPYRLRYCDLRIAVGDLHSGIIATGTIMTTPGTRVPPVSVSLSPLDFTWTREDGPQAGLAMPGRQPAACRFSIAPSGEDGQLRLTSYIHNLDFPLSVACAHSARVIG
ncbi:MAG TPA: hypothetical protein VGG25_13750 [Streptosporangiaceae bacterium]|jgi:hypothetical protein